MSSIDQRVVQMQFDNAAFERGVAQTLKSLDALNKGLQLTGAAKGLQGLGTAAAGQTGSLKNVEMGVQSIADRFKAMSVVGITALATVASKALEVGGRLAKSFTLDPLIDGFKEYELNLNSIQTILANTSAAGTDLKQVNATLDELNHYADQTIYSFAEMAKNIGTFTAAGVDLKTSAASIKGIANLAALSGSNSQQASNAMYQLSQAISSGRVSLEDWNSVVNAGMGGTVFQRALAQNAEKMGTLSKGAVKLKGDMKNVTIEGKSFRESITAKPGEKSWLTSDVLTRTLSQFTGDLTDAQLAAQGFNAEQIKAIQKQAQLAKGAATEVKTFTQLMATTKESVGSGWAETWRLVFGDFEEAKAMYTNISQVLSGFVDSTSKARNSVLKDWNALGGRTKLLEALANIFKALVMFSKPLRDAFRDIFPATTAVNLVMATNALLKFSEGLSLSEETAGKLRRIFAGLFAILGIGFDIVVAIVGALFDLAGVAGEGSGNFLELAARIGDFFVNLRIALRESEGLKNLFKGLAAVLSLPIRALHVLGDALGIVFKDFDGKKVANQAGEMAKQLKPLGDLGEWIGEKWDKFAAAFNVTWGVIWKGIKFLGGLFGEFGANVSEAFEKLDFQDITSGINTGLFGVIALALRNLLGGTGGGLMDNVTDALDNLTGALGSLQNTLRAATLIQIAAAVLILAFAMDKLSRIDAAGMTRAGVAITVMFTQLMGAMLIFEKLSGFTGFAKMPFVAASMILLAAAVNILATAMVKLSVLSWEDLGKGLTGVTALLGALIGVSQLMKNPGKLILTATGLLILAFAIGKLGDSVAIFAKMDWEDMAKGLLGVGILLGALMAFAQKTAFNVKGLVSGIVIAMLAGAIKTLASAVKDLSGMSWEEMAKGLGVMAAGLGIISGALKLLPASTFLGAASILIVAMSLRMIGEALTSFGGMSWEAIAKGLIVLAGSLAIIAGALYLMSSALPGAAALIVAAAALQILGNVLMKLSGLGWEEIAKGMVALAGALLIIAGGLYLMSAALPGAAALVVTAAALAILAPVLVLLGGMSWESIIKGLVAVAAGFAVIGIAAALLTPVIPSITALAVAMLALGGAMLLVGIAFAAFGAGVFLLGAGLALFAASGVAGTAAIVGMLGVLLSAIPLIIKIIKDILIGVLDLIIEAAPKLFEAAVVLIESLVKALVRVSPKIVDGLLKILTLLLRSLQKYVPQMVDAGYKLLIGILDGIAKNIGRVVTSATNVIVNFLNAMGKNMPRVVQAGVQLIINYVNGIANAIRNNSEAMGRAGGNLASAIIEGMAKGLMGGVGAIVDSAKRVARSALDAAKNVLGIKSPSKEFEKIGKFVNDGFRKGLDGNKAQVDTAFKNLREQLTAGYKAAQEDVASLEKRLRKLKSARKKDRAEIAETTKALAQARKERTATANTLAYVNKYYRDEQALLGRLANNYDAVTAKLKTAQETLNNAIKTRDDYNKSITDQFSDIASPTAETKVTDYIIALEKQVSDTKELSNTLQQLRKLGIRDELYKDLLSTGTSALPFIRELLAGGQKQIEYINKLDKELDSVAGTLGKTASTALYQAAVDSAAGIVKGLQNQQKAIEIQMDRIADAMVKAIKKKLGIKSPSRVFAEVGSDSASGVVVGLNASAKMVESAAAGVGDGAVEALRASMSKMSNIINGDLDTRPVIAPVLDLSNIKRSAGQIGSLLPAGSINVGSTYSGVKSALMDAAANRTATDGSTAAAGTTNLNYTQNNYSPKALSQAEIYRDTKNQLSTVKGALPG